MASMSPRAKGEESAAKGGWGGRGDREVSQGRVGRGSEVSTSDYKRVDTTVASRRVREQDSGDVCLSGACGGSEAS